MKLLAAWSALALWPAVFWVDTGLAYAEGWRPGTILAWGIVWGIAFFSVALASPVVIRRARVTLRGHVRDIVFLVVSQSLLVFGVDWTIPYLDKQLDVKPPVRQRNDFADTARRLEGTVFHHRAPNLDYVTPNYFGDGHFRTNSQGIRGAELPEDATIRKVVCIGGSTTEMGYLDQDKTWFQLAMNHLNENTDGPRFWFGGVGVGGYATRQHLNYVRQSSVYRQVDFAVFLIGVNDMVQRLYKAKGIGALPPETADPPVWLTTNTAQFLMGDLVPQLGLNRIIERHAVAQTFQARLERRRAAPRLDVVPPRGLVEGYKASILDLAQSSRAAHVVPVFLTHPTLWSGEAIDPNEDRYLMGETPSGAYLTARTLRIQMDAYNAAMIEVCDELDEACIDLSFMNGNPEYFLDDCHFTPQGCEMVAEKLAKWFQLHGGQTIRSRDADLRAANASTK